MEVTLGDKSLFAISCSLDGDGDGDGHIFIWLNNRRFGRDGVKYNVRSYLKHMVRTLNNRDNEIPDLFAFSTDQLVDFFWCARDDFESEDCSPYINLRHWGSQFDREVIFRTDCYGFDKCLQGVIENGPNEKMFILNEESMEKESVIQDKGNFHRLLEQMVLKLGK